MIALLALLQASLTIGLAGPATSPEYLPGHVAQAEGLFSAQQLRTTLRTTRSDVGAAELLATGQVELVMTSLDAAMRLGSRGGPPPRLVHGLTAAPPVALLVSPGRSESIRSAADLVGQTIAVPAPGTPEDQALGILLARAEVPMHRVTVQSLGERGAVRALESGQVGAAVLAEPHVSRLLEAGQAIAVVDLRTAATAAAALGGATVNAALFLRAGADLPPETLRALRAALQAAVARLSSTAPGELQRMLPPALIGSPADFAARLRSAGGLYLADGRVTPDALERSLRLVKARAPLPARVDLPWSIRRLLVE
jgi:ABC-type nitrate/sulfonate/bicarbonate transport system substrate-binding protein